MLTYADVCAHTDGGVRAVAAGEAHSLILRDDGQVLACGLNSHGQVCIEP